MKKIMICLMSAMMLCAQISVVHAEETRIDLQQSSETTYTYNAANDGYTTDYSSAFTPVYYIYAGQLSEENAENLLEEMGMVSHIYEWAASVTIVNPIEETYGDKDAEAFIDLLGGAISNVKVIGIDDGATFVNNYISQECYAVAGIMTYGGDMVEGLDYDVPVPVYLSHPCDNAVNYFHRVNEGEELAKVVVGRDENLKEAFDHAWSQVFSRNYRQHNEKTEFYMSNAKDQTDPYLLIGIPQYDELNVLYYTYYNQPLNGEGQYTWFEYIPKTTLSMDNGTVPLVVSLHGNGNDARLQGETTGWVELAAQENFMVVCPEWQDTVLDSQTHKPGPNFFHCDGLEGDKLIEWIDMLKEKYPQIDESRIYVTGLSAGGSASMLYGAKYNDVFAAVGAVSAPGVDKKELTQIAENYQGNDVPMMYICGDHDFFGMIPVDLSSQNAFEVAPGVYLPTVDENVDIFPMIQAYQKINGLEVSKTYDLSLNPYYGISLDHQQWIQLGIKETLEGTLSNENGVIMKFAAIKDQAHWNYKPEAQYLWNFFKNYSRQEVTSTDVTPIEKPTQKVDTSDSSQLFIYTMISLFALASFVQLKKKKNS